MAASCGFLGCFEFIMANLKASKKDIRRIAKRTAHNRSIRSRLKTLNKSVRKLAQEGTPEETKAKAQEYMSALDRAAKTSIIHPNKANRHKSMLSQYLTVAPQA